MGINQFVKKKFQYINIADELTGLMGKMPLTFMGAIYAPSGSGKTELCIRLAKELIRYGRVAWMSYEQGHDEDLQRAMIRNGMDEYHKVFTPYDPMQKLPKLLPGESMPDLLYRDFIDNMSKKNAPKYIFVDSIDYTGWNTEHYKGIKAKFKGKKGIIFIGHVKGKSPKLQVTKDIEYDGQFGIYVREFVAYPVKSRLGGRHPFVIWEEEVRRRIELNPKSYPAEVHELLNGLL